MQSGDPRLTILVPGELEVNRHGRLGPRPGSRFGHVVAAELVWAGLAGRSRSSGKRTASFGLSDVWERRADRLGVCPGIAAQ